MRASRTLPVAQLRPSALQPRRTMAEAALDELAQSIADKGVLQPLLVRRLADEPGMFEIVAGERRWRAAQKAQLHEVPVVIKELSDGEALEVALIENLQRQDLNPLEEAEGYRRLLDEFAHTQEDLGKVIGKSRSHIANTLRLLSLPDPIKAMMRDGQLTAGHARALLTADDPEALARQVVAEGLTVRSTEALAKPQKPARPPKPVASAKDPNTVALERDLSTLLGLRVEIRFRGSAGTLLLHYGNLEQLDDILHRLNQSGAAAGGRTASDDDAADWPATLLPEDEIPPESPSERDS
jgi:ParB family chromosome partitioning protein